MTAIGTARSAPASRALNSVQGAPAARVSNPGARARLIPSATRYAPALCFALGMGVCGCESCEESEVSHDAPVEAQASPPASASAPPIEAADAAGLAAPNVVLQDAGQPPRAPLRYKFHLDRPETAWMELHMTMAVEVGQEKRPQADTPPLRMALKLTPKSLAPDGTLQYDFKLASMDVVQDAGVREDMAAAIEAQTSGIVGLAGSAEVDTRGRTRTVQFAIPPGLINPAARGLLDNLRQSIRNIATVLPEEPVGPGARWEIAAPVEGAMFQLRQVSTFTLKERKGDKASIEVALKQEASPQPITMPGLHPGATAQLVSISSSGSGTVLCDLNKLVPESRVQLASTMQVQVQEQGTEQPMKISMQVQVRTTAKQGRQ